MGITGYFIVPTGTSPTLRSSGICTDESATKPATMSDLMTYILASRPGDWGRITVVNNGLWYDYSGDALLTFIPDVIGKQEVHKVSARGGYSHRDYHVTLKY